MQFLLTAYDGTDAEAPGRRLKVRGDHLEKIAGRKHQQVGQIANQLIKKELDLIEQFI